MYQQVENSKENKSTIVPNSVIQNKNNDKNSKAIVDNRPESNLQRKIGDAISSSKKNVAQLTKHPKQASGTGMARKDPGHGNVKSKQHAAKRAEKDGKREAKRAAERERLQAKRAAENAAKGGK
ncbi:hypothetical protein [Flavobacterium sp.]|uniref:hypothetical protein n=1 Tax=Flavobacterium sp. TaxID=239 RepID=UPI0031E22C4D